MTRDDVQALYEEWRQSGEIQAVFLARKQQKISLFKDNYKSLNRDFNKKKPKMAQMLPVQISSKDNEPVQPPQKLTYQFVDGGSLRFTGDTSIEYVSKLISGINSRQPC